MPDRPPFAPTDYSLDSVNRSSFGGFNYTGNWTPIQGGFRGSDDQGDFYYTPFTQQQNRGGVDGPGHMTQDGGWMPDLTSYYGIYQSPDGANSEDSARYAARYAPGTNLVNLTGNTNLPGVGTTNAGFGYMSRTPFTTERHTPYGMPFDLMADFVMPVVGSAVVGGAPAWGAAAEAAAAGAAGTTWASLPAEYASVIEAGALTGSPGYGAALESSLAGLGASGAGAGAGLAEEAAALGIGDGGVGSAYNVAGGEMPSVFDWAPGDPSFGSGVTELGSSSAGPANLANSGGGNWLENLITQYTSGGGDSMSLARLIGSLGQTALGAYGSSNQADALRDISARTSAERAPYLAASQGWLANPASYFAGPGRQSLDAALRALSVEGNPFGNPTSMALATEAGLRDWRNAVTGFGNMGLSGQDLRAQLDAQAAGADRGITTSLASGLGALTQPTLMDYLRSLGMNGLNLGEGVA